LKAVASHLAQDLCASEPGTLGPNSTCFLTKAKAESPLKEGTGTCGNCFISGWGDWEGSNLGNAITTTERAITAMSTYAIICLELLFAILYKNLDGFERKKDFIG
jgi:hypothetical protein